ncbi:MAG: hypothetical protein HYT27_01725 [Parcubacteria group bacterium]|nr:hypothetical protein [Parcubacteria group bacterium]
MSSANMKLTIAAVGVAALLIAGALFLKNERDVNNTSSSKLDSAIQKLQSGTVNDKYQFTVTLGEVGSEHSHISLLFFVNGEKLDFSGSEYMLQAPHMHFENGDGTTIHKHATGLNIPLFLASIFIRINQNCFMLDITEEFCSNESKKLTFIVNGEALQDIYSYELQDGDRVLINYGDDTDKELQSKFDVVPKPVSDERS